MKYKVYKKDFFVFILFAIFLLYWVAIAIANINGFANGHLTGLNPLPAFSKDLFAPTMVFYIAAMIWMLSLPKNIFKKNKDGKFGLEITDKKKDKKNRLATDKEMKKKLDMELASNKHFSYAGVPLISDGNEIYVDNSEYHTLVLGSTGSGKSTRLVFPMINILAKKGESMILTDPKGEIYEKTGEMLRANGYNLILINLRDPAYGNAWNPLRLPYQLYLEGNQDKAIELLDDLAQNIMRSDKGNADPFWENTSADYFVGLALALFEDAKPSEINLNSINYMVTVGEQKFLGSTVMSNYFDGKSESSIAYMNVSSTISAPLETKNSILSVFKQKIKLFSSKQNLSEMLSNNDFDMDSIGTQKTAVYIIVQDEKKTYHSLATIFLKQCYETLIDVAQRNGMELPIRTNFILDEFANMPPLKDVTSMISAARSRKIRYTLIIQNFAQLNEVYGKDNAETIKSNCGNILFLMSTELAALEEISKLAGEVQEEITVGEAKQIDKKPLIPITDLQRLQMGEAVLIRDRCMPYKTKLAGIWEYKFYDTQYKNAEYIKREAYTIDLFDIKKYVTDAQQQKLKDMMNKNVTNPLSDNKNTPPDFSHIKAPIDTDISSIVSNTDANVERANKRKAELEAAKARIRAKVSEVDLEKNKVVQAEVKIDKPVLTQEELREKINARLNSVTKPKEDVKVEVTTDVVVEEKDNEILVFNNDTKGTILDDTLIIKGPLVKEANDTISKIKEMETIEFSEIKHEVIKEEPIKEDVLENKKSLKTIIDDSNIEVITDDQFFDDFFLED